MAFCARGHVLFKRPSDIESARAIARTPFLAMDRFLEKRNCVVADNLSHANLV